MNGWLFGTRSSTNKPGGLDTGKQQRGVEYCQHRQQRHHSQRQRKKSVDDDTSSIFGALNHLCAVKMPKPKVEGRKRRALADDDDEDVEEQGAAASQPAPQVPCSFPAHFAPPPTHTHATKERERKKKERKRERKKERGVCVGGKGRERFTVLFFYFILHFLCSGCQAEKGGENSSSGGGGGSSGSRCRRARGV